MKLDDLYKSTLRDIVEKRTGGKIAIEGFFFQFQYSLYLLLNLLPSKKAQGIRLEGIEDLDVFVYDKNGELSKTFYQVKHSINDMAPSHFWNKGILQNFQKVYQEDKQSNFSIIYDMNFKGEFLKQLADGSLSEEGLKYWSKKLRQIKDSRITDPVQIKSFLNSISFCKITEKKIQKDSISQLIKHFGIATGNVELFYKILLQQTLIWSLDRKLISLENLQEVIKEIKLGIERGGVNNAVKQGWITEVNFSSTIENRALHYYEGISARPVHIANDLPVRRISWEKEVENSVKENGVTVIKASSGQGKSTIAWQTAFNLKQQGHSIYELNLCESPQNIGELCLFIETRYKYLGEYPIVVIDGLNQLHQSWNLLAQQLIDAPVKFIISSREEDWKRFGTGFSRLKFGFVNLEMSYKEAKDIFTVLQKNNLIHESAPNWQTAWETVRSRGVMIEYIFLMTHGQMLQTRLEEQIQVLNTVTPTNCNDSPAKIEILRLVSLADLCGITLKTNDVLLHVKNTIGFSSDRGGLINSLESEYYLTFSSKFIEGLHSVRSQHLFSLLHQHIASVETAINIIPFIPTNQIQLFYGNILSYLLTENINEFMLASARYFSKKSYLGKIAICDGLFQFEVQNHWEQNKEHYDAIHRGGGIKLAPVDTAPWMERKILAEMNKIVEGRLNHITNEVEKIKKFDPKHSVILYFLKSLQQQEVAISHNNYRGLGNFALWNLKFETSFNLYDIFPLHNLLLLLSNGDIQDAVNIADALLAYDSDKFISYIREHKRDIIPHLKKQTNTLTLKEEGEDLIIEYLLLGDKVSNGNEESVERIKIFKSILPIYERYCTQGIVPPLELYDYLNWEMIDSSVKRMPRENLYDKFQIHTNQMWTKGIQSFYLSSSFYDWQKQWMNIRKEGLNYVMLLNRVIESYLEGKSSRINTLSKDIEKYSEKTIQLIRGDRDISQIEESEFINEVKSVEKILTSWAGKLQNVISQTLNLFTKEENQKRHVTSTNVTSTYRGLQEMQQAFNSIANFPVNYFDTTELEEKETYWYKRLFDSVQFLINNLDKVGTVTNAKKYISGWMQANEQTFMNDIEVALSTFESITGFQTIKPKFPLHDELLTTVVMGISGFELRDIEDKFTLLCVGLAEFSEIELDFLTIILVKENKKAVFAWRFNKETLNQLKQVVEEDGYEEIDLKLPLPYNLNELVISPLEGVQLQKILLQESTEEIAYKLLEVLWILSQYRVKLNMDSNVEAEWMKELEIQYKSSVEKNLSILEKDYAQEFYEEYLGISKKVINQGESFSDHEFRTMTSHLFHKNLEKM